VRGIVSTGLYVPRGCLDGDAVAEAWGTGSAIERAAVAAADEDSVTMAVAAGRDALDGADIDAVGVRHLAFATTTPPLEEEAAAPRVAAALGLSDSVRTTEHSQHTAVAADALRDADAADGPALAVVADAPAGDAADVGSRIGAAAVAVLFDADGAVALAADADAGRDAPGIRYRERGSESVETLDVTGFERSTTRELVADAVDSLGVDVGSVAGAALHQPTPDVPGRIAKALELSREAVDAGTVVHRVGDAGAATPALGLLAVLDGCSSGDTALLGAFGSGATASALAFSVDRPLDVGVDAALDGGESLSYPEALRERGTLGRTEVAGGGAHVSLPSWQRTLPQRYRLRAGRCPDCGALAFPPEGACPDCHARLDFESVTLPREGRVVAATVVGQGGAPPEFVEQQRRNGAFAVAVVELERGDEAARLPAQLTDCDPGGVDAGDRVRAVFRRIYRTEGVDRYGLKFTPV
jgi:3-hydroxy-3-methylglutaryl CoA synthase/uncharacterized OB-fold protein